MRAEQTIAELLANGPKTVAELIASTGHRQGTVGRALALLSCAGLITSEEIPNDGRQGRRCKRYWLKDA